MTGIVLRDRLEIQRAHDILSAVILVEVPIGGLAPVAQAGLLSALDALFWVLNHRHNITFQKNLKRIEKALEEKGCVLRFRGEHRIIPIDLPSLCAHCGRPYSSAGGRPSTSS